MNREIILICCPPSSRNLLFDAGNKYEDILCFVFEKEWHICAVHYFSLRLYESHQNGINNNNHLKVRRFDR